MSNFRTLLAHVASGLAMSTISAAAIMMAGGAQATNVTITIAGPDDPTTIFTVPQNPTPDLAIFAYQFELQNVNATISGAPALDDFTFYSINSGGALSDDYNYDLGGSQYYAGDESTPTFLPGVYTNQINYANYQSDTESYALDTVTITDVPEPASWALVLVGIGALGGALRARRAPRDGCFGGARGLAVA